MNIGLSVPLPSYKVDAACMARKAKELGFEPWHRSRGVQESGSVGV